MLGGGALVGLVFAMLPDGVQQGVPSAWPAGESRSAMFALCSGPVRVTCVVDGDTFWIDGTKIRVADIDTPETFEPRCAEEAALGHKATARMIELLNAGPITLVPIDRETDRYGRTLRIVERDGESLGAQLVREGLAHRWGGPRREWC